MAAAGHQFFTPTYTGLGERGHLASQSNDLETHIQDVLGVLTYEDLREVVLIGLRRHGGDWRRRSGARSHCAVDLPRCVRTREWTSIDRFSAAWRAAKAI
jgi:hypothetical protein